MHCILFNQVMVATVRCEEIANEKFNHLTSNEVSIYFSPWRDAFVYGMIMKILLVKI